MYSLSSTCARKSLFQRRSFPASARAVDVAPTIPALSTKSPERAHRTLSGEEAPSSGGARSPALKASPRPLPRTDSSRTSPGCALRAFSPDASKSPGITGRDERCSMRAAADQGCVRIHITPRDELYPCGRRGPVVPGRMQITPCDARCPFGRRSKSCRSHPHHQRDARRP